MTEIGQLPRDYQQDIQRAVEILRSAGCTDVFVFGSLSSGRARKESDIDLAVRGCPKGKFFHLLGRLLLELDHPVDLVSLDSQDPFARHLEEEGDLVRIDRPPYSPIRSTVVGHSWRNLTHPVAPTGISKYRSPDISAP